METIKAYLVDGRPIKNGTAYSGSFIKSEDYVARGKDATDFKGLCWSLDNGVFTPGMTYELSGVWKPQSADWGGGQAFHINLFSLVEQGASQQDILREYLLGIREVGIIRAGRIVKDLGETCLDAIDAGPACLLPIQGIDEALADKIYKSVQGQRVLRKAKLELLDLFAGTPIPNYITGKFIKKYKALAFDALKDNPFSELHDMGVGFKNSDIIYLKLKNDPKSLERFYRTMEWAYSENRDNSTWVEESMLVSDMQKHLRFPSEEIEDALDDLQYEGSISCVEFRKTRFYTTNEENETEKYIADSLADRLNSDCTEAFWPGAASLTGTEKYSLKDSQIQAYRDATQKRVGLLVGPPGSGKTFLISRIVDALWKAYGVDSVALCAPTNKAAVRLSETMASQGLRINATTIHQLLHVVMGPDGQWYFEHGPDNLLDMKFIIIDELSMVGSSLFQSFLRAVPVTTCILLVGDQDQLVAVGRGAILRDLLETSAVPCGKLTEVIRNEGEIVKLCQGIRQQAPYSTLRCLVTNRIESEQNVCYSACPGTTEALISEIQDIYDFESAPAKDRAVTELDFHVITATNVMRKALNTRMQKMFNAMNSHAGASRTKKNGFCLMDKIICTKNGTSSYVKYEALVEQGLLPDDPDVCARYENRLRDDGMAFLANGEIGQVVFVGDATFWFKRDNVFFEIPFFPDPNGKMYTSIYEEAFDLGYTTTCHKYQGDQCAIVVVTLDRAMESVADRHWLYTAISRAERRCYLIGDESYIDRLIPKSNMQHRFTFLSPRLRKAMSSPPKEQSITEVPEQSAVRAIVDTVPWLAGVKPKGPRIPSSKPQFDPMCVRDSFEAVPVALYSGPTSGTLSDKTYMQQDEMAAAIEWADPAADF